jgi:hypothetical protein
VAWIGTGAGVEAHRAAATHKRERRKNDRMRTPSLTYDADPHKFFRRSKRDADIVSSNLPLPFSKKATSERLTSCRVGIVARILFSSGRRGRLPA